MKRTAQKRMPRGARSQPSTRRVPEETRARLVVAAKRLFARSGLHGVAVSEIASEAGVSAAMINHHFGGKEGLYRACIEGFATARLRALDRYLVVPKAREEMLVRLEMLVTELLELHLEDPEVVAILLRDVNAAEHWGPELEEHLYSFTPRLARFFGEAQGAGFIRRDVDPIAVASIIYLSLSGLLQVDAHRERVTGVSLRDQANRKLVVKRLLDVVLHGVLP